MNVKALMFGVLGMLIFGSITVAWISKDMEEIRAEERAELTKECAAAKPADASAAAAPAGAQAAAAATPATGAAGVSPDLVKRCEKIGVTLTPAEAPLGNGAGVAPLNQTPTAPATPLAPLDADKARNGADAPLTAGANPNTVPTERAAGRSVRNEDLKMTPDAVPTDAGTGGLPPRIGRTSSISMADPRE